MFKYRSKFLKMICIVSIAVMSGLGLVSAADAKTSPMNALYVSAGNAIAGNPKGHITMIEFFDYNCGYCRMIYPKVQNLISEDKNLRVIFREYPVLSPTSVLPAEAALAAAKQGKYPQLHEAMMEARMPLTQSEIVKLAQSAHINTAKLLQDMKSPSVKAQIQTNLDMGRSMNIQGVPTFIVVRTTPPSRQRPEVVVGPSISDLKQMIAQAQHGG